MYTMIALLHEDIMLPDQSIYRIVSLKLFNSEVYPGPDFVTQGPRHLGPQSASNFRYSNSY